MVNFIPRQEFDTFMGDSELDVASKEKDVEHKQLGDSKGLAKAESYRLWMVESQQILSATGVTEDNVSISSISQ